MCFNSDLQWIAAWETTYQSGKKSVVLQESRIWGKKSSNFANGLTSSDPWRVALGNDHNHNTYKGVITYSFKKGLYKNLFSRLPLIAIWHTVSAQKYVLNE